MILAALFAALAVTISVASLRGWGAPPSHTRLPWWALAVGFALCEVFVVHVDRGAETHTFSLMEVPLVVGLFLVAPIGLVVARLVGSGAALAVHRRQPVRKLAFNLSLFALETTLAAWTFRSLVGDHGGVGPPAWGAAFLACLLANLVGAGGVAAAIAVTTGAPYGPTARRMLLQGVVLGPVANTSLALVAAVLLWYDAAAAVLLVSLGAVLALAYQAYSSLSRRYANLQRLYDYTKATDRHADEDEAVTNVLDAARRLLRADRAELVLAADEGRGPARRTGLDALGASTVDDPFDIARLGTLWELAATATNGVVIPRGATDQCHRQVLDTTGWRDCVAVSFRQDEGIVGLMALADCSGDVNTFDGEDLALFSALVNHAAVTLQNSRLVSQLQHDALHDNLTGLPNRTLFNRRVQAALGDRRPGEKVAVLLMDLDRFKDVNDTLGHHHGDRLLVDVARRLEQAIPHGATVARLGGDEFAVLLASSGEPSAPLGQARALAAVLDEPLELDDLHVPAGASIGIAICPDHGEDATTLLQRADVAMYVAKTSGVVEVYSPDRDDHSTRRLALVSELRAALEGRAIEVWYQPKADATSGTVTGAEALVRWNHRERGMVPPDEFIPVAERTGVIGPLTAHVLGEVTQQWRAWQDSGTDLRLAVNLSMRNLHDPRLVEQITEALSAVDMPPSALTLEITESTIMSDPTRVLHILNDLAGAGVRLAVDDFGTGYSSLTYLRRLPVSEIKVDKTFVIGMDDNPGDGAIVRSVIGLGRNLGLAVVAEGVETAQSWQQLTDWGCHIVQGYYLSRPLPPRELTEWLKDRPAGKPQPNTAAIRTDGPLRRVRLVQP